MVHRSEQTHQVEQTVIVPGMGPLNLHLNVVRTPESNLDPITHPLLRAANEERTRQIDHLDYTAEHDAEFTYGELAAAAVCYLTDPAQRQLMTKYGRTIPTHWPFGHRDWKPKDRYQDLIRAVALAMAEYDRLKAADLEFTEEDL